MKRLMKKYFLFEEPLLLHADKKARSEWITALCSTITALYHTKKAHNNNNNNVGYVSPKPHIFLPSGKKCRQEAQAYAHQSRCQTNSCNYWCVEGAPTLTYLWTTWSLHLTWLIPPWFNDREKYTGHQTMVHSFLERECYRLKRVFDVFT